MSGATAEGVCGICGYALAGLDRGRCPECGAPLRVARALGPTPWNQAPVRSLMGLAPVLARPRATLSLPSQRGAVNWLPALIFSGTILAATSVLWTVFKSVGCSISMAIGESPRVGWELLQRYFSQLPQMVTYPAWWRVSVGW